MNADAKRWRLLALNGILWVGAAKLIDAYIQNYRFYSSVRDVIVLVMIVWLLLVGLHALWVFYREIRKRLMRWAMEQAHEKRKHDQTAPFLNDDNGELITFPEVNVKHER